MPVKVFVDAQTQIPFTCRLVQEGDRYGLNLQLVHKESNAPLVEFYDVRYPRTDWGQFVTRYALQTLLERNPDAGILLDGGMCVRDSWVICDKSFREVHAWLTKQSEKKAIPPSAFAHRAARQAAFLSGEVTDAVYYVYRELADRDLFDFIRSMEVQNFFIGLGAWVVCTQVDGRTEFWNQCYGWVSHRDLATGYSTEEEARSAGLDGEYEDKQVQYSP